MIKLLKSFFDHAAPTLLFCAFLIFPVLAGAQNAQQLNRQFHQWLENDLWPEARSRGVSKRAFNAAFNGVELDLGLPDLVISGAAPKKKRKQSQAEFSSPAKYFRPNVIGAVIAGGNARLKKYAASLKAIEQRTGVPGRFLLAIWGRESGFGRAKIPHNAFQVLGTKAFLSTRKEMFRAELLAALEMVSAHNIAPAKMKSSWAGALGQPQFMPSSFLAYAKDFTGDGVADIWGSDIDTLGSIAHFLALKGWQKGQDWGFEVRLPDDISCALEGPDNARSIRDWASLGIARINGKPFPDHELDGKGSLLMPAGRFGPAFIVTPNFYVFKDYNYSDLYALFVGHAGDRIKWGGDAFKAGWENVGNMYRSDIAKMQKRLESLGYDVGGADGLPGFRTRRSIGDWQEKNGQKSNCFPTSGLMRQMGF